jgi:hypothetical protein
MAEYYDVYYLKMGIKANPRSKKREMISGLQYMK